MIGETYESIEVIEGQYFVFISEGLNGIIPKAILYSEMANFENRYNLGFGDMVKGKLFDNIISNNDDLIKVMNTVASTIYRFFEIYPASTVHFEPVDGKRSKLYHTILRRRQHEIEQLFYLNGYRNGMWEIYNPDFQYLAFEIRKK